MSEEKLEDVQELITEETVEKISVLEELSRLDFEKDEIDIDKYYKAIEGEEANKKLAESLEAENQIKRLGPKYLEEKSEIKIAENFIAIDELVKKFSVEKDEVKNMDAQEYNKIFGLVKHFNLTLSENINRMVLNIQFNRKEYDFLSKAFKSRLIFNGNDILLFNDLQNLLYDWETITKRIPKTFTKDFILTAPIKDLVVLYQFLSKLEVKGTGSDSFQYFSNIINRIKDANDLFNAYNVIRERSNSKFLIWTSAINELEESKKNTLEGKLLKPVQGQISNSDGPDTDGQPR